MHKAILAPLAFVTLSACVGGSTGTYTPRSSNETSTGFRTPQVMRAGNLDGIVGANAGTLTRRFGDARIDLAEGDARKLQYASDRCVLDIYLYPLSRGQEPVATQVFTRDRESGSDVDSASCIADVENQRRAR